jgi:hypothetical protein
LATLKHQVIDNIAADHLFVIDPVTRLITNEAGKKQNLIQYDHNSERFTFSLTDTVEGHDMTKCDKIIIHAINIDGKTRLTSEEEYVVQDLTHDDTKGIVNFSWLISNRCTQYAGSLSFLVSFVCTDESGTPIYVWNTAPCKAFNVLEGINNSDKIEKEHADILLKWRAEIEGFKTVSLKADTSSESGGENVWTATFADGTSSELRVRNGEQGNPGIQGKSAYEVAVENGYEGTATDFINEMIYPKFTVDGVAVKNITFNIEGTTLSINTET